MASRVFSLSSYSQMACAENTKAFEIKTFLFFSI